MKKKLIPLQEVRSRALRNAEVKARYDALEEKYALLESFVRLRSRAGLSQEEMAARMGTTQSVIARIESGQTFPSLKTLYRYAHAAGMKAVIRFQPLA